MLGISTLILGTVLATPMAPIPHGVTVTPSAPPVEASTPELPDPFGNRGFVPSSRKTTLTRPSDRDLVDPFAVDPRPRAKAPAPAPRPSSSLASPFSDRRPTRRIAAPSSSLPDPFAD